MSSISSGRIKSIDTKECLAQPGVVGLVSAEDVPGVNLYGLYYKDEEYFVTKQVRMINLLFNESIITNAQLRLNIAA